MEGWKKIKFENDLKEWWGKTLEKHPNLDKDYHKMFPAVLHKAKLFDVVADKFLSKDLDESHTEEGCVFMSKVALRAAQLANVVASLTGLTYWKVEQEELKEKRTKKEKLRMERLSERRSDDSSSKAEGKKSQEYDPEEDEDDYYSSDDSDDDFMFTGCVRQIKLSFTMGKDNLIQSMLRDLQTWDSKVWIQETFANVLRAKKTSDGRYLIYGNPTVIGEKLRLDVDAYVIPRTKTEEGNYLFNIAKGEHEDRVISTAEAVMFGHWRMATFELKRLKETEVPTFSEFFQFFEDDEDKDDSSQTD